MSKDSTTRDKALPEDLAPKLGGRMEITLPGKIPMAFRLIPPGMFRMGARGFDADEEPVHQVQIVEPYWLGETPVTQAQFAAWTLEETVEHRNGCVGVSERPAEHLDWRMAVRYCDWLARVVPKSKLPDGFGLFCLPTEAEWERACRAGTETEYHTGDGEAALAEAGWFDGNSGDQIHKVGKMAPNGFGLYDMHGNVWEWCHDVWNPDAYRSRADGAWDSGREARQADWKRGLEAVLASDQLRAVRGGSWRHSAAFCRSAIRDGLGPYNRSWIFGFRVCLVRGPAETRGARRASRAEPGAATGDGQGTRRRGERGVKNQFLAPSPRLRVSA